MSLDWITETLGPVVRYLIGTPLLLLLVASLPMVVAAWRRKAYPHVSLVLLAILPCVCSVGVLFGRDLALAGWRLAARDMYLLVLAVDAAVIFAAIFDYFTLPRRRDFEAERTLGHIASLQKPHKVTLLVSYTGRLERTIEIRDDIPLGFDPKPEKFTLKLKPRSRATMHYMLRPNRRGAVEMENVYLRAGSRLGLWRIYFTLPVASRLNVYPDMKQLAEYAVLARTNRLSLMGLRRTRRVGQDNEFERLRDYTLDDNFKHIDWRTTARRNKLTVKDFQTNQSQRIIFLVDCGRMMTGHSAGVSLLDHSLNAILMLSYIALQKGDSVGLICFSDRIINHVPPAGSPKQMNHLLHAVYDQFPQLVESRYDEAFLYLSSRCRKRSLVVLITSVIDEVNSHQIQQYLGSLSGKHLPLGVLLRDHQLFDQADSVNPSGPQFFRSAAAAEILNWRHQVLRDLEHRGSIVLDVFPEDMTAPLINKYLDVKARHLL